MSEDELREQLKQLEKELLKHGEKTDSRVKELKDEIERLRKSLEDHIYD